jgi:hypothetical protein
MALKARREPTLGTKMSTLAAMKSSFLALWSELVQISQIICSVPNLHSTWQRLYLNVPTHNNPTASSYQQQTNFRVTEVWKTAKIALQNNVCSNSEHTFFLIFTIEITYVVFVISPSFLRIWKYDDVKVFSLSIKHFSELRFMPLSHSSRWITPGDIWIGGWMDLGPCLNATAKRKSCLC